MRWSVLWSVLCLALLALSLSRSIAQEAVQEETVDAATGILDDDDSGDTLETMEEEVPQDKPETPPQQGIPADHPLNGVDPEKIANMMSKLSPKCLEEVQANPQDPSAVSPRCQKEIQRRIMRLLEREQKAKAREERKKQQKANDEEDETKKKSKKKDRKHKPKTSKREKKRERRRRRQTEAEELQRQEQQATRETLKIIIGFVGTLVAIVVGAMCVINRKLKKAGLYYPADPTAKATCGDCPCD